MQNPGFQSQVTKWCYDSIIISVNKESILMVLVGTICVKMAFSLATGPRPCPTSPFLLPATGPPCFSPQLGLTSPWRHARASSSAPNYSLASSTVETTSNCYEPETSRKHPLTSLANRRSGKVWICEWSSDHTLFHSPSRILVETIFWMRMWKVLQVNKLSLTLIRKNRIMMFSPIPLNM